MCGGEEQKRRKRQCCTDPKRQAWATKNKKYYSVGPGPGERGKKEVYGAGFSCKMHGPGQTRTMPQCALCNELRGCWATMPRAGPAWSCQMISYWLHLCFAPSPFPLPPMGAGQLSFFYKYLFVRQWGTDDERSWCDTDGAFELVWAE